MCRKKKEHILKKEKQKMARTFIEKKKRIYIENVDRKRMSLDLSKQSSFYIHESK